MTHFHGVIPPVSTIFTREGILDKKGMGELIDFLIEKKVHGLFFLGTGGEFSQMSIEQRKETASFVIEYVGGRLPVLIGTGTPSTDQTLELTMHAQNEKADGVVIINPYYWSLSEENLFNHYKAIASRTKLPIILYNFPNLTGQDLSPEFVVRLVEAFPNITGIKETVDSGMHLENMITKVKKIKKDFKVFCGFENYFTSTLIHGGDGIISASGNFAPELSVELYNNWQKGNLKTVVPLQRKLSQFPLLLNVDTPFINVIKSAIQHRGLHISDYVLPPGAPLASNDKKKIGDVLMEMDIINKES